MRDQSIERVVFIFPGALGDLLLALPAMRLLRARRPSAHCTLVVGEPLRSLASLAGLADEVASLDSAEMAGLFAGGVLPRWLAGRPHVYSWLGAGDDEFRSRLTRAAASVRFLAVERGQGATHAAVAYARAVGVPDARATLAAAAQVAAPQVDAVDTLWSRLGAPVLAVHAGAGARAKRWDAAGFVQVAQWWRGAGGTVVSIAGPAEADEPPVLGAPEVREWPLPALAAVLARTALYLGHDSGVSHLAGAVGAAGVVLFGPTDPRRWRPAGGRLVALRARASGPDGIALAALPVARVIAACRRRFALTRVDLDTSVAPYSCIGNARGTVK